MLVMFRKDELRRPERQGMFLKAVPKAPSATAVKFGVLLLLEGVCVDALGQTANRLGTTAQMLPICFSLKDLQLSGQAFPWN